MDSDENLEFEVVIKNYVESDVLENTIFLPICAVLSLYLIVQKAHDNLMTSWYMTLLPLNIYFGVKFLTFLLKILKHEENDNIYNIIRKKIKTFENISTISDFFSLLQNLLFLLIFYYLGRFLDEKKDENLFISLYISIGLVSMRIVYSFLRTLPFLSIMKHAFSYTNDLERHEDAEKSTYAAFIGTVVTPILTYFSNMMIICSSSTGMCTQVYMSTVTSLLGAFGVSISNFSDYLFPITVVLLGISLVSLFIKRKKLTHKPFLLGLFASFVIIVSHFADFYSLLHYSGNILMIVAAYWNYKMNKLTGLPRFKN